IRYFRAPRRQSLVLLFLIRKDRLGQRQILTQEVRVNLYIQALPPKGIDLQQAASLTQRIGLDKQHSNLKRIVDSLAVMSVEHRSAWQVIQQPEGSVEY